MGDSFGFFLFHHVRIVNWFMYPSIRFIEYAMCIRIRNVGYSATTFRFKKLRETMSHLLLKEYSCLFSNVWVGLCYWFRYSSPCYHSHTHICTHYVLSESSAAFEFERNKTEKFKNEKENQNLRVFKIWQQALLNTWF